LSEDTQSPRSAGEADIASLSQESYEDLRRLAKARLRSSGPLTLLDTAGLVGDTYQRLAQLRGLKIENRALFLGYCSRIMRSIIVDLIRDQNAKRRGGGAQLVTLNTEISKSLSVQDEPLRIDETLAELAAREPRLAQVVEMRYFGGYTEEEVAEALNVTVRTVQRDWVKAKMVLKAMLASD
jgi:RNA polymerase sigma factor (TIGR02999 family)